MQIRLSRAYAVFLDGSPVAGNGNLDSGNFTLDMIRIFPLPRSLVHPGSSVLVLRIRSRYNPLMLLPAVFNTPQIRLGDRRILTNDRAGFIASLLPVSFLTDVPFIVIGIVGVVLLGFSLYDRTRIAPIVLAAGCIGVGLVFGSLLAGTLMVRVPVGLFLAVTAIGTAVSIFSQYWFPFALAGRPVPLIFRLPMGILVLFAVWHVVEALVPLSMALRLDSLDWSVLQPAYTVAQTCLGTACIVAFWPWKRIPPAVRPIAALALAWGLSQLIFFAALLTDLYALPGIPNIFRNWMFPVSTIAQFFVIAAIIALHLRDQRQVALHRASLAGEMQAAQEIQRTLAQASVDTLPGLDIRIAFLPAREVGGDFYSCTVLPGNRQRLLLGDVSGKGAAAAMTAAVLLGAAQEREQDSPAALLEHLNRVMTGMRLGGFATCLCAEITDTGALRLANAGHFAPYRNGEELKIDAALPLGLAPDHRWSETIFQLALGDTLTFLSDGIVEARSATGELFGFDRTRQISSRSAGEIASAAQCFGQQDDITVLTLAYAPAASPRS